jgi:geranyl diphosphate 2-C-methyltransferase
MVDTGFSDGSFQGVITNETTMYVDLPELFGEFARVLAPGGRYVCITWCRNDLVADSCPQSEEIDRHYISRMHRRSSYFAAMAQVGLVPTSVVDLTAEAIPYWELRTHSAHRTGIEQPFIDAYRANEMNFLLIVAEKLAPSGR